MVHRLTCPGMTTTIAQQHQVSLRRRSPTTPHRSVSPSRGSTSSTARGGRSTRMHSSSESAPPSASPSSTCHLDQHPGGTSASLVYSSQRFEFVPEKKPAYEAQLSLPGRGSRGLRRAAPRRLLAPARVAALLSAVYRILFRSRRSCRKSNTIPPECHFCTQSM